MKRALTLILLLLICSPAEAANVTKLVKGTPLKKLGRGIVNTLTGVLELPRETHLKAQEGIRQGQYPFTAYPEGLIKGLLPGTFKALARTGSGLYDIVTFPVEQPANYGSVYQPATIFAPDNWTLPPQTKRSR